jgi:hypothetical protein
MRNSGWWGHQPGRKINNWQWLPVSGLRCQFPDLTLSTPKLMPSVFGLAPSGLPVYSINVKCIFTAPLGAPCEERVLNQKKLIEHI